MKFTMAQAFNILGTALMALAALYSVYVIGRAIAFWMSL